MEEVPGGPSTMEADQATTTTPANFRSVLPHETLPIDELGYIHVQGGFEPKRMRHQDEKMPAKTEFTAAYDEDATYYWTKENLEETLVTIFSSQNPNKTWRAPFGHAFKSATVLDGASSPPFTKVRLCYASPLAALQVVQVCRSEKISPHSLFSDCTTNKEWQFTSRPLQVTPLTTSPLLSTEVSWRRSNPPKFRRLIGRPGESADLLQQERQSTRFVFLSGLLETSLKERTPEWWNNTRYVREAIRKQANAYDTSGLGVEVFVSIKKNKATHFCHVGMRSPDDAIALILAWQGKILEWELGWSDNNDRVPSIPSGKLFLDYAAVTQRSNAKAMQHEIGGDIIKGEKSRPECTSTTSDVTVPGLVLIPDFVSSGEEEVLLAALTGPTAPWAPTQINFSKSGAVKRKVQHYGYVFDYETANVLRDRSQPGADCPPLPGLPQEEDEAKDSGDDNKTNKLEYYFQQCVQEGRGWEALACLLERTRRKEIVVADGTGEVKQFLNLNQITVNSYEPGEGIGSHVDTPSAFGDGLISVSLNGGVVMEFRKQNSENKLKKLVYLPPRSLLLMSGPARFEWDHMIVTRMTDTHNGEVLPRNLRVSLTMRTAIDLAGNPMPKVSTIASPPTWGEDNNNSHDSSSDQKNALVTPSIERDNVHAVYDAIATQWHHTRGKRGVLWPGATQFLTELPEGSIVADVGCGDGKYFPAIWEAGSFVIGTDISLPLLQQAAYRGDPSSMEDSNKASVPESRFLSKHRHHLRRLPAVAVADCMNIPMRTKSCDAAICIAVMHHLSTRERRLRCIAELGRIVKVGGLINIQAWAMEQQQGSRRKFAGTDVFVPFNAQPKYLDKADTAASGDYSDEANAKKSMAQVYSEEFNAAYDEKKGLVVFKRYCHLYRSGELEEIVSQVDIVSLYESGYESGNHFVILKVIK